MKRWRKKISRRLDFWELRTWFFSWRVKNPRILIYSSMVILEKEKLGQVMILNWMIKVILVMTMKAKMINFTTIKFLKRRECDIVLESSEDSKDSEVDAKVSDESKDSEVHDVSWNKKLDVEKSKVANVDDEDSKDCEVIIDTSEDEVDKASSDVEELDESDESDSEVKDLNFS